MFPAPKATARRARPDPGDTDVTRLRVVDADSYTDWESVYHDNADRLYRLMYARVGNRPDAEDLTSEVFKTALGPLRLASSKGEVRSYLLVTAQTVLASHWRRHFGLAITTIDPESDLNALVEPSGLKDPTDAPPRAGEILDTLPDRYRRILE